MDSRLLTIQTAAQLPRRLPEMDALSDMIRGIDDAIGQCEQLDETPTARLEAVMRPYLGQEKLLENVPMTSVPGGYKRHLLHADPEGRFTLLALVWSPGAITPIHGHHAWGTVGVHRGTIGVSCYRRHIADNGTIILEQTRNVMAGPGDLASVNPDPEGIHRIYNDSHSLSVSLHVYGMDLSREPGSINRVYVD